MASLNPSIPLQTPRVTKKDPEDPEGKRRATHLPVIPDLRFEHSYLRSISGNVNIRRIAAVKADGTAALGRKGKEKAKEDESLVVSTAEGPTDVFEVHWRKLLWITVRDQVLSPFLQGTVWAIAGFYFSPYSTRLRSHIKIPPVTLEGAGVGWLRRWINALGLSTSGSSRVPTSHSSTAAALTVVPTPNEAVTGFL